MIEYKALPVADRRYSKCAVPLDSLDFSTWWTDGVTGGLYLHVPHKDKDDGCIFRVFCRGHLRPRLKMVDGVLCWLVPGAARKETSGALDEQGAAQ